jgi:hypothetical protein
VSALVVYVILANGDVESFDEVRNPHGGAPHIWKLLAEKYKVQDPMAYPHNAKSGELWQMWNTGKLTQTENTILGFTFDAIWVKREHVQRLIDAIEEWWPKNKTQWSTFEKKEFEVTPTLPSTADILKRFLVREDCLRGVCFNMTSVCSNPWMVRLHCPTCKRQFEDESRPFNFDKDERDMNGNKPFELFEHEPKP